MTNKKIAHIGVFCYGKSLAASVTCCVFLILTITVSYYDDLRYATDQS